MEMDEQNNNLTASEHAQIWSSYMSASLTATVLTYFVNKVVDDEIRSVIQDTLDLTELNLEQLTTIFEKENKQIPIAFTDDDVNLDAPRLYSDNYCLQYVFQMQSLVLNTCSMAMPMSTREDVYAFYSKASGNFSELMQNTINVSLSKGLYTSPPIIPTPNEVDFVKKQSFLTGWFGERRPLTALEIANLYSNMQRNSLGIATLTGFSQVAKSKEVKEYIIRGIEIAKKHVNVFSSVLKNGQVPAPQGSDAMVTDSNQVSPFSDKLMLFHVTGMITLGIGFYGLSISTNIRRDLVAHYTRLSGEIALYSEDGANIMIDNGWLEEPPRMVDRDELAKQKKERS